MYPLLLKAPIKDYLWGGTKLKTDFGFETEKGFAVEKSVLHLKLCVVAVFVKSLLIASEGEIMALDHTSSAIFERS